MTFRLALLATLVCVVACRKHPGAELRHDGRLSYDTSAIDVTAFADDPEVQARILGMPFGAAAQRLGSLTFNARAHFVFSRGTNDYEQSDTSTVTQDASGDVRVVVDTLQNQVEFFLVDPYVYIRQDKGSLRKKPRREVATEAWGELPWSSIRQSLMVFQPRLRFVDAQPDRVAGRETTRFRLALLPKDEAPSAPAPLQASVPLLPSAPPAKWRELARPLDVAGQIFIDAATGVVLKMKLEGRLEIPDRDVRPTQLSLNYEAEVKDVGKVAKVAAPTSVAEYERTMPPEDPLTFFRDVLPKEEASAPKKAQ